MLKATEEDKGGVVMKHEIDNAHKELEIFSYKMMHPDFRYDKDIPRESQWQYHNLISLCEAIVFTHEKQRKQARGE